MKDSDHELQGREPDLYYSLRKQHYRDNDIASGYDDLRFGGRRGRRNAAKWRTIKRGLTLAQAQAHCKDPETSSRTCTDAAGLLRTRERGPWFDGYTAE